MRGREFEKFEKFEEFRGQEFEDEFEDMQSSID